MTSGGLAESPGGTGVSRPMWLEAPVEETDERGNKRRSTRNRDEGRGSPQGSPISPLLSNLYMRRFVLGWKKLGHEKRLKAYIINYADDLVICCQNRAEEALVTMRDMVTKLKLTMNETKTRVCKLPEEKFDFLGYTFGRCYSSKTGRAYLGTTPSKKRVQRICEAISQETGRNKTLLAQETVIKTSIFRTSTVLGPIHHVVPQLSGRLFPLLIQMFLKFPILIGGHS